MKGTEPTPRDGEGRARYGHRSPRGARPKFRPGWYGAPKINTVSHRARWVHLVMLSWSAEQGTGGLILNGRLSTITGLGSQAFRRSADDLVLAGLWKVVDGGWQIIDFDRLTSGGRRTEVDEADETPWIRAVRQSREYREARDAALERDEYRCRALVGGALCGGGQEGTGGWLEVHHIEPICDGGDPLDVDNLVTLCNVCHRVAGHGVDDFVQGNG